MYTLNKYLKNNIALANSLVIKTNEIARAMNLGIAKTYATEIPQDNTKWKYYLNIAGEKHFSNNDVQITLIETNKKVSFTKDVLYNYSYTRDELLKQTNYYKELLTNYPDDTLYIKGCLFPVDITTAINAPNGTILNYNDTLVEVNEYNIINDIEDYVKNYFARWHIVDYVITDELYLPAFLATLYASLPNKIQNIRLSKINTTEVNSFHMENFFRSHLNLWDELSVLKQDTIYWLYKNLHYIMKNVGKEKVFNIILEKIFKENGIGVGEFILRKPNLTLDTNNTNNLLASAYQEQNASTITKPLNSVYNIDNNLITKINTLATLEMNTDETIASLIPTKTNDYYAAEVENKVSFLKHDNQKTKVLDLNTNKLFDPYGVDTTNLIIDIWGKTIKDGKYDKLIDFTDGNITATNTTSGYKDISTYNAPDSGKTYSVTPKGGFLMLIKLLLLATGNENTLLTKLTFTNLFDPNKLHFQNNRINIWDDIYSKTTLDQLENELPQLISIVKDPSELTTYIKNYISYYKLCWVLDSNAENFSVSENIKLIMGRTLKHETYTLSLNPNGQTIDDILADNGIVYNIPSTYNLALSISTLLETFTGMKIDISEDINNNLKKFKTILTKLTSYTIHSVTGRDDVKAINVKYNNLSILKTATGVIAVTDGNTIQLEPDINRIEAQGNDFLDTTLSESYDDTRPILKVCSIPIQGFAVYNTTNNDIQVTVEQPTVTAMIQKPYIYDASLCETTQEFLLGVDTTFDALDNRVNKTVAVLNDFGDEQKTTYVDTTQNKIVEERLPYIQGITYSGVETEIKPSVGVEISDSTSYDIFTSDLGKDEFLLGVDAEISETRNSNTIVNSSEANTIGTEVKNSYTENTTTSPTEVNDLTGTGEYNTSEKDIIVEIPEPTITGEIS